jgi:hypothetical protein
MESLRPAYQEGLHQAPPVLPDYSLPECLLAVTSRGKEEAGLTQRFQVLFLRGSVSRPEQTPRTLLEG